MVLLVVYYIDCFSLPISHAQVKAKNSAGFSAEWSEQIDLSKSSVILPDNYTKVYDIYTCTCCVNIMCISQYHSVTLVLPYISHSGSIVYNNTNIIIIVFDFPF